MISTGLLLKRVAPFAIALGIWLFPVLLFFPGGGWIAGSKRDALPEVYLGPVQAGDRRWPSMLPSECSWVERTKDSKCGDPTSSSISQMKR